MQDFKDAKLTLKDVRVVFSHIKDPKFGSAITIDVTDDSLRKQITDFYTKYSVNGGTAKFKDYTSEKDKSTVTQFTFKISPFLTFADTDGNTYKLDDLSSDAIPFNSHISMIVYAYEYDNNFGKGVTCSASTIVLISRPEYRAEKDLKELLKELQQL